jgi:signal transduction histidine kinase/FixJ family two-component response regulator
MSEDATPRVLVVDDDADTRANLADILELDGWQVATAGTAAEALNRDDWPSYAAVVFDRLLPDGSADELLPRVRRLAPQAEVVVVTGHADVGGAIAALRQGAADYILKPIDAGELRARLGRIAGNLTARRELRKQESILRLVLDTISDGVLVVDAERTILLSNLAMERIIGPVVIGTGPQGWPQRGCAFRPDAVTPCPPVELALAHALRGETTADVEQLFRRPGQDPGRWVSASASPLRDAAGATQGAVVVFRDITERKRSEERLLQSERLAAIGQMVTGLTHESGNALQRSQACLQILANRVRDQPDLLDLVGRIQAAQDHLLHLYEDVRGYASAIRLQPLPCDLADLWRQAWGDLELLRHGRRADLRERADGTDRRCRVDPFRLKQVFRNVLENALAACPDPVVVEIAVSAAEVGGRPGLRVAVRNNGPGLTAEQEARMFEPFYTTKTKGTGLGLAIVRRIVEAHEGRVGLGDGGRPGCEVVITLPREAP